MIAWEANGSASVVEGQKVVIVSSARAPATAWHFGEIRWPVSYAMQMPETATF